MPPDFTRDVRCVLGLTFDCVSESGAEQVLRRAIAARRRCFVSTPNLNFVVASLADPEFRDSVLQSDLSLADGWPIVAISRLTCADLPERVAGSSLFARLTRSAERPAIAVYFFGGPDGAARQACERLNIAAQGVAGVGFNFPGFGSAEEMSGAERLQRINAARPDFLVVALPAKKGQVWIRRNLEAIEAPVISNLGAVVNFAAGTVSRAPPWVQACRLEWLWRIKEEPSLWRRYLRDGRVFLGLVLTRALPAVFARRVSAREPRPPTPVSAVASEAAGRTVIRLAGAWSRANDAPLRALFARHAAARGSVSLDLAAVESLDSASIGLLALLYGWQVKIGAGWEIRSASAQVRRGFHAACADGLLDPRGTS
ncbi:MAG: WecB/TagA/CpsF family glycosyltransferase [Caldimonas sp.]